MAVTAQARTCVLILPTATAMFADVVLVMPVRAQ